MSAHRSSKNAQFCHTSDVMLKLCDSNTCILNLALKFPSSTNRSHVFISALAYSWLCILNWFDTGSIWTFFIFNVWCCRHTFFPLYFSANFSFQLHWNSWVPLSSSLISEATPMQNTTHPAADLRPVCCGTSTGHLS